LIQKEIRADFSYFSSKVIMHPHFLALPLPSETRSRLASFCYGLPQVRWVEEENFHLTLRHFGPLAELAVSSIHEHLLNLFFPPIPLVLQGFSHFHAKGNRGTIWVGVADNPQLTSLKKEIDRHLRELHLPKDEHPFHPHITLGHYDRLNPQRFGDYLTEHADYQSLPLEINRCLLMRSMQTPKHIIYETVAEYSASPQATGDD
jgi:2'-5' RNA ligase